MKIKMILILLLLCSCTQNKFSGCVLDFDSNKPIENVTIKINGIRTQTDSLGFFSLRADSNSSSVLKLSKEGYVDKHIIKKPISSDSVIKNKVIYMFKRESEFLQ